MAGEDVIMLLLNLLLFPLVLVGPYALTRGVAADERGLHIRPWFGRGRLIPWEEVRSISVAPERWADTTAGRFALSPKVAATALRLRQARQAAEERPETSDPAADLARIRGWLGIAPGQVLSAWVRAPGSADASFWRAGPWLAVTALLSVGAVMLWVALGEPATWPLLLAVPALWPVSWLVWSVVSLPPRVGFSADEYGIDLHLYGGRQRVAWDEIVQVREGEDWALLTRRAEYRLPRSLRYLNRLEHALQQAVDARQRGEWLPRLTAGVPDGALSRAAISAAAERGVSRSDALEEHL